VATPNLEQIERANGYAAAFYGGSMDGAEYGEALLSLAAEIQGREIPAEAIEMLAARFREVATYFDSAARRARGPRLYLVKDEG